MKNQISRYNPFHGSFGFMDPFFDDFFTERKPSMNQIMKTDIKDNGDSYELKIELPEISKENIHLSLENGYLTVEAEAHTSNDEKDNGKYIRKERYYGNFSRSYYVGENVRQEDIKAKLDSGVLTLNVKKENKQEPAKKYIEIE